MTTEQQIHDMIEQLYILGQVRLMELLKEVEAADKKKILKDFYAGGALAKIETNDVKDPDAAPEDEEAKYLFSDGDWIWNGDEDKVRYKLDMPDLADALSALWRFLWDDDAIGQCWAWQFDQQYHFHQPQQDVPTT